MTLGHGSLELALVTVATSVTIGTPAHGCELTGQLECKGSPQLSQVFVTYGGVDIESSDVDGGAASPRGGLTAALVGTMTENCTAPGDPPPSSPQFGCAQSQGFYAVRVAPCLAVANWLNRALANATAGLAARPVNSLGQDPLDGQFVCAGAGGVDMAAYLMFCFVPFDTAARPANDPSQVAQCVEPAWGAEQQPHELAMERCTKALEIAGSAAARVQASGIAACPEPSINNGVTTTPSATSDSTFVASTASLIPTTTETTRLIAAATTRSPALGGVVPTRPTDVPDTSVAQGTFRVATVEPIVESTSRHDRSDNGASKPLFNTVMICLAVLAAALIAALGYACYWRRRGSADITTKNNIQLRTDTGGMIDVEFAEPDSVARKVKYAYELDPEYDTNNGSELDGNTLGAADKPGAGASEYGAGLAVGHTGVQQTLTLRRAGQATVLSSGEESDKYIRMLKMQYIAATRADWKLANPGEDPFTSHSWHQEEIAAERRFQLQILLDAPGSARMMLSPAPARRVSMVLGGDVPGGESSTDQARVNDATGSHVHYQPESQSSMSQPLGGGSHSASQMDRRLSKEISGVSGESSTDYANVRQSVASMASSVVTNADDDLPELDMSIADIVDDYSSDGERTEDDDYEIVGGALQGVVSLASQPDSSPRQSPQALRVPGRADSPVILGVREVGSPESVRSPGGYPGFVSATTTPAKSPPPVGGIDADEYLEVTGHDNDVVIFAPQHQTHTKLQRPRNLVFSENDRASLQVRGTVLGESSTDFDHGNAASAVLDDAFAFLNALSAADGPELRGSQLLGSTQNPTATTNL